VLGADRDYAVQDFQQDLLSRVRVASTIEDKFLMPLSEYILELALLEYKMLRFSTPMLAGASVLLARVAIAHIRMPPTATTPRIYRHSCRAAVVWTQDMEDGVGLDAPDLEDCTQALLLLLWLARKAARQHAAAILHDLDAKHWGDFEWMLVHCGFGEGSDAALQRALIREPCDWDPAAFLRVFRRYCCSEHQFVSVQPLIATVPPEAFASHQAFDFATEAFGSLPVSVL
jgi:hypothetical protein